MDTCLRRYLRNVTHPSKHASPSTGKARLRAHLPPPPPCASSQVRRWTLRPRPAVERDARFLACALRTRSKGLGAPVQRKRFPLSLGRGARGEGARRLKVSMPCSDVPAHSCKPMRPLKCKSPSSPALLPVGEGRREISSPPPQTSLILHASHHQTGRSGPTGR